MYLIKKIHVSGVIYTWIYSSNNQYVCIDTYLEEKKNYKDTYTHKCAVYLCVFRVILLLLESSLATDKLEERKLHINPKLI